MRLTYMEGVPEPLPRQPAVGEVAIHPSFQTFQHRRTPPDYNLTYLLDDCFEVVLVLHLAVPHGELHL